ncbi:DUF1294 domain-containing protein [Mediterraneibacter agrestimuris]|uniref:DUF1294 domain-containing protein n=1 Tax=Mediterraneibacter agrestimuris TaxID=2941333 RepID=UPI00203D7D9E|nr:DUF1294 domain-containing protein [Mediterraneibacter agrestimuris]
MFLESCIILINVITFLLFGEDKKRARQNKYRIPERTLLLFAFFGGAFGALIGMKTFHHKTRKRKFRIGVPMFLIMQLLVLFFLFVLHNS